MDNSVVMLLAGGEHQCASIYGIPHMFTILYSYDYQMLPACSIDHPTL
jgi:hypothetical protein